MRLGSEWGPCIPHLHDEASFDMKRAAQQRPRQQRQKVGDDHLKTLVA